MEEEGAGDANPPPSLAEKKEREREEDQADMIDNMKRRISDLSADKYKLMQKNDMQKEELDEIRQSQYYHNNNDNLQQQGKKEASLEEDEARKQQQQKIEQAKQKNLKRALLIELKQTKQRLSEVLLEFEEYKKIYGMEMFAGRDGGEKKTTKEKANPEDEEEEEEGGKGYEDKEGDLVELLKKKVETLSKEKYDLVEQLERRKVDNVSDNSTNNESGVAEGDEKQGERETAGRNAEESERGRVDAEKRLEQLQGEFEAYRRQFNADIQTQNVKELERVREELSLLKEQHEITQSKTQLTAGKSNMLALELADHERSIEALGGEIEEYKRQLRDKDEYIASMDRRLEEVVEEKAGVDREMKVLGMKFEKLKALYAKVRAELNGKAQEAQGRSGEVQALEERLKESEARGEGLVGENERLQSLLQVAESEKSAQESGFARLKRALEREVEEANERVREAKAELADLQKEHNTFRVRAHNLLKQARANNSGGGESAGEGGDSHGDGASVNAHHMQARRAGEEEKLRLNALVQEQRETIEKLQGNSTKLESDLVSLQHKYDHVVKEHLQVIKELEDMSDMQTRAEIQVGEWENKCTRLAEDVTELRSKNNSLSSEFEKQLAEIRQTNGVKVDELSSVNESLQVENERLGRKVTRLEDTIEGLMRNNLNKKSARPSDQMKDVSTNAKDITSYSNFSTQTSTRASSRSPSIVEELQVGGAYDSTALRAAQINGRVGPTPPNSQSTAYYGNEKEQQMVLEQSQESGDDAFDLDKLLNGGGDNSLSSQGAHTSAPRQQLPSASSVDAPNTGVSAQKLADIEKQVHHLRTLLMDSEQSCSRLMDQERVLKSEIRRMNLNEERNRTCNLEYLKNVLIKFLETGDREHLTPVLTTVLKCSKEEVERIKRAEGARTLMQPTSILNSWWNSSG
eukprot:Nk52_evm14s254 gene=Nk52_evmTU14s254